ncbi:MAG: TMEM165/GDT1 family protein [Candidatus Omnitrophica bacterium]|nr:TMEM165/GDT1 family protein [Candidatus Omnitrophota bacterium]MDD5310615.1 TMEM165/GDT1 family protein [Candidatus Omnitrophota bacterium]MDD5545619.1 TMEM165/GDT1 family protein [Candidatus Omnitrophota bacterium]
MDPRIFFTIFTTVLLAELGDKTQLATLLFSTNGQNSRLLVFLASASALVLASGIAVLVGNTLGKYVEPKHLSWIAGIGFVIIGIWTIAKA